MSSPGLTDHPADVEALQLEANRYRALIDHASDIIAITDETGRIAYVNQAFHATLGWEAADWVGRGVLDLVAPDDLPAITAVYRAVRDDPTTPRVWRGRGRHADGSLRWLEGSSRNELGDPAVRGIVINCRDVSERVWTEEALRASEERLQQAVAVARVGIFDHDMKAGRLYGSRRVADIFGYDPETPFDFAQLIALIHPGDRELVASAIAQAHDPRGDGVFAFEHRVLRPDGQVRWVMARSQSYFEDGPDGARPVRTIGAVLDVTDMRRADESLQVKELAIAHSINAIGITDAAGQISYVNPAFIALWGYDSDREILGRHPMEFVEREGAERVMNAMRDVGHFQGELVGRRRDGSRFDLVLSASEIRDAHGHRVHVMGSILDISESKQLQQQLMQSQKMESIGRLAGGIAHDFNNLLTVIKGFTDMALEDVDAGSDTHADLQQVSAAANSAASLTSHLLAFSRKQLIDPQVLDLADVIPNIERMLRRLLGEDIELRVEMEGASACVRFDRAQLEQVLINLAVNARDAMPNGGRLTIATSPLHLTAPRALAHGSLGAGDYVVLAVRDTGTGMSPEIQSHIFEPFFTTKRPGKGTGLGLPMVYGAVTQNGGALQVRSAIGRGTDVTIYLPCTEDPVSAAGQPPLPRPTSGTETILLVEDDDSVRAFARQVLAREGYRVLTFAHGGAALRALEESTDPVHLLLTDVIMPEMNGQQVAERVVALRPGVRVLYCSGYTDDAITHHGVFRRGVAFLPKPFSGDALRARVRAVLDAPVAPALA